MEGNIVKLLEQSSDVEHVTEELFQNRKKNDWDGKTLKKNVQEHEEEETLKLYLDNLKKENFTLETSMKAWQNTLEIKMNELKETELKLEEKYNEIWSEREKFCSKLDKFNDEYGVLSNWWEEQIKLVSEFENIEEKTAENCREEIEKLEKEIAELKTEIEEFEAGNWATDVQSTAERDSVSIGNDQLEVPRQDTKKVKFSETDKKVEVSKGEDKPQNDLYSLVDLEKVKMAKRRRKNLAFVRATKIPKY